MLYQIKEGNVKQKSYSKLNLFIRSLFFSIYSLTSMAIYSFLVVASLVLPVAKRHALIRVYIHIYMYMLNKICHINYKIEGLENIPKDRTGIVLSKHQSTSETFILPLIFHNPAIIVKRELLWLPFFGWGLAAADPIVINRSDRSKAMQQIINKGKKCLEAGRWVLMFPEGTRIPFGQVGKYRLGGARLAVATGYPIIPVAHNAGYFWPKRQFIKRPGTIRVVIGPLIEPQGLTPEEVIELTKNWIEGTVVRLNALVDSKD